MNDNFKPKKGKRLSESGQPLIYTESLMEIFDFNDDALQLNESGSITQSQQSKITETLKEEVDSMWLLVTIFLAVAVLLALIFSFQGYAPLPLVIGVGTVVGSLLAIAYFRQTRYTKDTSQLQSESVVGMPFIAPTLSGDKQVILVIGNKKLPISYQQAAALSEFALPMMRVYYASHSKQILSAEVLDDVEVHKLKNEDLILDEDGEVYEEQLLEDEQSHIRK